MHLHFRNVNDAFQQMVAGIHSGTLPTIKQQTRNGDVLRLVDEYGSSAVTITYLKPRERMLFNPARDANPFFHLFEALYMLAGRNDVAPLKYYVSDIDRFSDDGEIFWGGYGARWRNWFGWDQLDSIVAELIKDKETRRVVLQMWDAAPGGCGESKCSDFWKATHGGKDVPCNTEVMFDIIDGKLNMSVINRSNDLIWGTLGANVVHFSFLQEYIACRVGVEIGVYNQISNNQHVYTDPKRWQPELWLSNSGINVYKDTFGVEPADYWVGSPPFNGFSFVPLPDFEKDVRLFVDNPLAYYQHDFLNNVARPMMQAFAHHKARQYGLAFEALDRVQAEDWKADGIRWITKCQQMWERRNESTTVNTGNDDS